MVLLIAANSKAWAAGRCDDDEVLRLQHFFSIPGLRLCELTGFRVASCGDVLHCSTEWCGRKHEYAFKCVRGFSIFTHDVRLRTKANDLNVLRNVMIIIHQL